MDLWFFYDTFCQFSSFKAIGPHSLLFLCFQWMKVNFFVLLISTFLFLFYCPVYYFTCSWYSFMPFSVSLTPTATLMHICIYNSVSRIRVLPSVTIISLLKFWVSFTASVVWARATFNNYWSVDIQLLLERPFNHKSWFIVASLTIPLKCCLANQVHSLSWRTNLLQGCQNKSLW